MYKATNPLHGVQELIGLLDDCVKIIKKSVDDLSDISKERLKTSWRIRIKIVALKVKGTGSTVWK
jgi:hypothetical protein